MGSDKSGIETILGPIAPPQATSYSTRLPPSPAVLAAEAVFFGKRSSRKVVASIVLVCAGVGLSTVTDTQMGSNLSGWLVGAGAITATAAYQIWAGTKQKELNAGSMALLEQYSPLAAVMLGVMVPIFEPLGLRDAGPGTLRGYTSSSTPSALLSSPFPFQPHTRFIKLLEQYSPLAAVMLGVMVPIFEPLGLQHAGPNTGRWSRKSPSWRS